ncbi:MAG: hypothetical protein JWQ09_5382, partial [Segetibacter sp.]|nr:hypothetical protein [Segetibacter sp.]
TIDEVSIKNFSKNNGIENYEIIVSLLIDRKFMEGVARGLCKITPQGRNFCSSSSFEQEFLSSQEKEKGAISQAMLSRKQLALM